MTAITTFVTPLVGAMLAGAADVRDETLRNRASTVRLEVRLLRQEMVQNEPAVLEVVLANVSGKAQVIVPALEPHWCLLRYHMVGPDGKERPYQPILQSSGEGPEQELAPGESIVHRQMLLYDAREEPIFAEPGRYRIKATYRCSPKGRPMRLTSNTVWLSVRPATGVDAQALKRFRGGPQAAFGMGWTSDYIIAHQFSRIVRDYPSSVYAPWSRYFLGRGWQLRKISKAKTKAPKALPYFEALLKDPEFPLAVEVRYQIAKEYLRLGREEEAFKRFEELFKQHANWRLFQRAQFQMEVYRDNPDRKFLLKALP